MEAQQANRSPRDPGEVSRVDRFSARGLQRAEGAPAAGHCGHCHGPHLRRGGYGALSIWGRGKGPLGEGGLKPVLGRFVSLICLVLSFFSGQMSFFLGGEVWEKWAQACVFGRCV